MIGMRDILRNLALAPRFSPSQLPVAPQWGIILLFAVSFLAGLATLYYMLRKVAMAANSRVLSRPKARFDSSSDVLGNWGKRSRCRALRETSREISPSSGSLFFDC